MRRLVCLSLVMLLVSCSDRALEEPDWRFITDSADHTLFCIDQTSLQRGFPLGARRAWVKSLSLEGVGLHRYPTGPLNLQSVVVLRLEEVDCSENTTTTISWIEHRGKDGRSGSIPEKERVASPVVPGSVYAPVVNAICRGDLSRFDQCPAKLDIPSRRTGTWRDHVVTP